MNKQELLAHLEALDRALQQPATLYIYGSAASILLDEPDRTSLDVDVAAPYSTVDQVDLWHAAQEIGFPVNPADDYSGDHIEWVGPLRLCLPPPVAGTELTLWQGARLRIQTGSLAALIASKLIRYDELDRGDIQYLLAQGRVSFFEVESAVSRLPAGFATDSVVQDNLVNLKADMQLWRGGVT
jgi:hypothetical protein